MTKLKPTKKKSTQALLKPIILEPIMEGSEPSQTEESYSEPTDKLASREENFLADLPSY